MRVIQHIISHARQSILHCDPCWYATIVVPTFFLFIPIHEPLCVILTGTMCAATLSGPRTTLSHPTLSPHSRPLTPIFGKCCVHCVLYYVCGQLGNTNVFVHGAILLCLSISAKGSVYFQAPFVCIVFLPRLAQSSRKCNATIGFQCSTYILNACNCMSLSRRRELERSQSQQLESSSIAEFGVRLDSSTDNLAPSSSHSHISGSTPLRLPQAADSTPVRPGPNSSNANIPNSGNGQRDDLLRTGTVGIATAGAGGRNGVTGAGTGTTEALRTPPSKEAPGGISSTAMANQITPERGTSGAQVCHF